MRKVMTWNQVAGLVSWVLCNPPKTSTGDLRTQWIKVTQAVIREDPRQGEANSIHLLSWSSALMPEVKVFLLRSLDGWCSGSWHPPPPHSLFLTRGFPFLEEKLSNWINILLYEHLTLCPLSRSYLQMQSHPKLPGALYQPLEPHHLGF